MLRRMVGGKTGPSSHFTRNFEGVTPRWHELAFWNLLNKLNAFG